MTTPMSRSKPSAASAFRLTRPYAEASYASAAWQLGSTLAVYAVTIGLMFAVRESSLLLCLGLSIVAAAAYLRLFMIGHDCSHGSFMPRRWQNEVVGNVMGLLTNTPFDYWARQHHLHHQGNGNLDKRGDGDVQMMTVEEYRDAPWIARAAYRIYRNPFFLFGIAAPLHFLVLQRVALGRQGRTLSGWASVLGTNLGIALYYGAFIHFLGLEASLWVLTPVVLLSASMAVWLFYVQHQYEGTYFQRGPAWSYQAAALEGCSFYDLPGILHWASANIGYHHIHHLNPKVPSYRLPRCHFENATLQPGTSLGLAESLGTARLALWQEDAGRLISFADLAARTRDEAPNQDAVAERCDA